MSRRRRERAQRVTRWARKQWTRPRAEESASHGAEVRGAKRNGGWWKRIAIVATLAVGVSAAAVSACLVLAPSGEPPGPPRAAIVDQLSLTVANPAFVQKATNTLEQAGYVVDYYPGEHVTVGFFHSLPTQRYKLLIFRVHSGLLLEPGGSAFTDKLTLFTSEPYDELAYLGEQVASRLARVYYNEGLDEPQYFGITPEFVESSMQNTFRNTTVVLMGCNGLSFDAMAKAFVGRGAKAVVGWSDLVSASHTDTATEGLLEHLLVEELSVEEAVAQTMAEVGPDPAYDSQLLVYPSKG